MILRQRQRCKSVASIIFGHTLHNAQIDAICILAYEQQDLLLLAKTGFGKSLIFQQLPFMTAVPGVVLILMPLKLLQAEQSKMINSLPKGKAIVLNGENNLTHVQRDIARGGYTHVLTSPEIAISKNFKKNILDDPLFSNRLSLLAIDEIHLVEQWGYKFRPLYSEIDKVRKRIPCGVPLLGESATLTKRVRSQVLEKFGFQADYKLMQIHRFMNHAKSSCLNLQFLLPQLAKEAKDIQKTVIFVNTVNEIQHLIDIIRGWMKKTGLPTQLSYLD